MFMGQQECFSVPFKKFKFTYRGQWGRLVIVLCSAFIGGINTDIFQVQQKGIHTHKADGDHLFMGLNVKIWILNELDDGASYHKIDLKLLVQHASASEK